MTSSTSFSHREALLSAQHGLDLHSLNDGSNGASSTDQPPYPHRPHLGASAEWSRQLQSFQFDPVLRSPFFHALGERREYYVVMCITVCLWVLLVFQTVITGWPQVVLTIALLCALNLPILLIEFTRMNRRLLVRLWASFEWWYLFLSYVLMQAMSLTRTVHIHHPSAADVVYLCLLNLIRYPQCLIVLTPVCKLTQQDEARPMELTRAAPQAL